MNRTTYPNHLSELDRLAADLESFGEANDLPMPMIQQLNLCLDELFTNIVSYAFDDRDDHEIALELVRDNEEVTARLTDTGKPFDPFHDAPAPDLDSDLQERKIGGLGVFLVKELMDEVAYSREADRNVVTLTKVLDA